MAYPILPGKFIQLPEEVQKQVMDYIEFLIAKYGEDTKHGKYPLRGSVKFYNDPTGSVAENDWEVLS